MSESDARPVQELTFGEAMAELETIVSALESGQLELEDSLTRYERGVGLLRDLQGRITEAQQKVTMLIGELEEESSEAAGGEEA